MKRFLPLGVVLVLLGLVYGFDLHHYLSFSSLKMHREALLAFVAHRYFTALAVFAFVYVGVVALSIPGASLMTLTGGFLFGLWVGTGVVVCSATLGATLIFLATRTSLSGVLEARAGPWLEKLREGFQRDAFAYLFALRLIPVLPFFILNLAPAFLGVPTRTFILGTFFGIIPGSFVYVSIGRGLGSLLEADHPSLKGLITPEILLALCGLALLTVAPILYRRLRP